MDDEQPLAFDNPQLDSDHSTLCSAPLEPGLPEDAMEVHVPDSRAAGPLSWWGGRATPPYSM